MKKLHFSFAKQLLPKSITLIKFFALKSIKIFSGFKSQWMMFSFFKRERLFKSCLAYLVYLKSKKNKY